MFIYYRNNVYHTMSQPNRTDVLNIVVKEYDKYMRTFRITNEELIEGSDITEIAEVQSIVDEWLDSNRHILGLYDLSDSYDMGDFIESVTDLCNEWLDEPHIYVQI